MKELLRIVIVAAFVLSVSLVGCKPAEEGGEATTTEESGGAATEDAAQ